MVPKGRMSAAIREPERTKEHQKQVTPGVGREVHTCRPGAQSPGTSQVLVSVFTLFLHNSMNDYRGPVSFLHSASLSFTNNRKLIDADFQKLSPKAGNLCFPACLKPTLTPKQVCNHPACRSLLEASAVHRTWLTVFPPPPPVHHRNPQEVTVASQFAIGVPRHIWHGPVPGKLLEGANCWWPQGLPTFPMSAWSWGSPNPPGLGDSATREHWLLQAHVTGQSTGRRLCPVSGGGTGL